MTKQFSNETSKSSFAGYETNAVQPFSKKEKEQKFYSRHFLNNIDSDHTGVIRCDFKIDRRKSNSKKYKGYYWHLFGGMEIRDCVRRIDLTFDGNTCLLYTSPSPRDGLLSRMPSSA